MIAGGQRLFPLHLAPIDSFFLLEDRPDYPMTFVSNLFFRGQFQREALEQSVRDALKLHPLLHAYVRPAKQNRPCWVAASQEPVIDWGGLDQPVDVEARQYIDLQDEPGLRVWVRQGQGQSRLVLQFHHACCDGTGAHRFMGDLLAYYGILTARASQRPEVASYDPQLLKTRRFKLADKYNEGNALSATRRGVAEGLQVFGKRIAALAPPRANGWSHVVPAAYPGVVSHTFDKDEHTQLRHAASQMGVTLNDLLLAEMFCTMSHWNQTHGTPRRQTLRIMMPSDMRDKDDFAMPAANMASYNFLTRSTVACHDLEQLVKSIRDETARIKHKGLGRHFIDSIMAARYVPGLLPFLLSGKRCFSTITMSHMGDPTRRFLARFPRDGGQLVCGDVVLENMLGVSPLRPQTRASVAVVSLYRQLTINLRCDPLAMTLADSQTFLHDFTARLQRYLVVAVA